MRDNVSRWFTVGSGLGSDAGPKQRIETTMSNTAMDTLGYEIRVEHEIVDGQTLIVLERAGEVVFDLDPQDAARLGAALVLAAG